MEKCSHTFSRRRKDDTSYTYQHLHLHLLVVIHVNGTIKTTFRRDKTWVECLQHYQELLCGVGVTYIWGYTHNVSKYGGDIT